MPLNKIITNKYKLAAIIIISIAILDQISKQLILEYFYSNAITHSDIFPGFNLVLVLNKGVSFGLFAGKLSHWALIGITLAVMAIITYMLVQTDRKLQIIALSMVIAGAIGNNIDRVIYQAVIDFLDFYIYNYHWPAFNVADSSIVIGVGILLYDNFLEIREEKQEQKNKLE